MGCDIHIYTETFDPNTNTWANCDRYVRNQEGNLWRQEWYQGRYYELFMLLAQGVRGDVPWGLKCQGLPDDISEYSQEQYDEWGGDAHSPSYITFYDLVIYSTKIQMDNRPTSGGREAIARFISDWRNFITSSTNWIKWWIPDGYESYTTNDDWEEDIRIVYWFDN